MHKIHKTGLPPGTLVHIGKRKVEEITFDVIDYNTTEIYEKQVARLEDIQACQLRETVKWVNVNGLHDDKIIAAVGESFGLHPLILEDIMNTEQRPKISFFDEHIFIVIKMLNYVPGQDSFESEQLSLVFGKNFVITFQEEKGDVFDPIRERLRRGGKIREWGPDYLAYALLDLIVDTYYYTMDRMGDWIEKLEDQIMRRPERRRAVEIKQLRRDIHFIRKNVWPVRELLGTLLRHEESPILNKDKLIYYRDVYEHIVQVIDMVDTQRDMIATLMDLYLSNISYKLNEIMKVLTIMSSIFIPVTFIASIYGMNFEFMPELHSRYAYYIVLGVMATIILSLVIYFRRKRWL